MVNFILIAVCIIAGMLFRRYGTLPGDTHRGINAWIIYMALPAVSFKYLPHIHWGLNLLAPVIAPVLVWMGGWCMLKLYKKFNGINETTAGGLLLTGGLANTSFVGFPLITAYFGEKYIGTAIICDQVTFFLLATAGIVVAINASKKQKISARMLLKRVFTFPPFLGCLSALVIQCRLPKGSMTVSPHLNPLQRRGLQLRSF
jgi:predicted permease